MHGLSQVENIGISPSLSLSRSLMIKGRELTDGKSAEEILTPASSDASSKARSSSSSIASLSCCITGSIESTVLSLALILSVLFDSEGFPFVVSLIHNNMDIPTLLKSVGTSPMGARGDTHTP